MKKYKGLLALLILFFGFTTAYAHSPLFKVTRVLQGDLIEVSGQKGKFMVRLTGIDSPEFWQPEPAKSQPFARQARDYLASLIQGKMVKIRSYGGQAGCFLLGEVLLGKKNINLEMVKAGLAEVFRAKIPQNLNLALYKKSEAEAKAAKKGMWIQGDKYVSPMLWCKRQKAKSLCSFILYGILQQGSTKK